MNYREQEREAIAIMYRYTKLVRFRFPEVEMNGDEWIAPSEYVATKLGELWEMANKK